MKSGIYRIQNITDGKCYIGSAINIKERWSTHRSNLELNKHDNTHLKNAYNKYGVEFFEFSVIEFVENEEDLIKREQFHMDSYDWDMLYNIRLVAESNLGFKHTEESKIRMSVAQKGHKVSNNTRKKIAESHKGKKHSEETKKKISIASTGHTLSEESKDKLSKSKCGDKNPMYGKSGEESPRFGKCHSEKSKKKMSIQSSNVVEFNGKTQNQKEWAKNLGITEAGLTYRLKYWSIEKALTTPVRGKH